MMEFAILPAQNFHRSCIFEYVLAVGDVRAQVIFMDSYMNLPIFVYLFRMLICSFFYYSPSISQSELCFGKYWNRYFQW